RIVGRSADAFHHARRAIESGGAVEGPLLQLHADHADLRPADVLERVRRQRVAPERDWRLRARTGARVREPAPAVVAADELAPRYDVEDAREPVRVERNDVAGPDTRVEDADALVLEEERVMPRRGDERVEGVGPRPVRRSGRLPVFAHRSVRRAS